MLSLLARSWNSTGVTVKLVADTSKAMCCVLRSGSTWLQFAAARVVAATGGASTTLRRAVCSVIGVECSREVGA